MRVLQGHPGLRRAIITLAQLLCAAIIYSAAALAWPALGNGHSRPGLVPVLAATAVVAAVLALSRRGFERVANWLTYGEHADGYELASGFLTRMATTLDVDEVLPRLAETAARSVGSRRGEVRVWLADGNTWQQTWPNDAAQGEVDITVPVQHGGDPVGQMAVSVDAAELSPADHRLLNQLAGPAGLALSTVRLTHALRQQAAEIEATTAQLQASRQRIVRARRGEQDRIRGQLATSIQPHLDAASLQLTDARVLDETGLGAAREEVGQALDELRVLARGLFPAGLADMGLVAALRSWAEQRARAVVLASPTDFEDRALAPDVAAALYFCAVTVLSAADGQATVTIQTAATDVIMEVRAERFEGASFEALVDRAEAFDGEVVVAPPPGAVVRIRLPCRGPSLP
jgi:hypothetical protein